MHFGVKRIWLRMQDVCVGFEWEYWSQVLNECSLYEDLRALNGCGVCVNADGSVNAEGILECNGKY